MDLTPLIPFGLLLAVAGGTALAMLAIGHFIGPKRPNPVKDQPFECGIVGDAPPTGHIPVHFYRIAILFVLFDIEIAFLYPWAIRFRDYGWTGLAVIAFFVGFLFLGFVYLWRKGVLEWD